MKRIAFLGLGLMGGGMARRLLGAGFPVAVYNRTRSRAEALAADGATVAATPREAAAGAQVVISMLADDAASRATWMGEDGALAAAAPGTVLIESSTISFGWAKELAAAAEARGCRFLDAPVTGSKPQAEGGNLQFLAGGAEQTLDEVRDVLAPMSRGVVHIGPQGSGALLKLVNNFLCGVQSASIAEAVAMIERSGLDRDKALTVLSEGAPGSPLVRGHSARMVSHDFKPNFALALMVKDLTYAIAEAQRLGVPAETAQAAVKQFQRAVAAGFGEQDVSAVVEPLR